MRGLITIACLFLVAPILPLQAQVRDIRFDGNFRDAPFEEFVEVMETQNGVSFYFLASWTRGIRVTATGEDLSLRSTLDKILLPAGLTYHMDEINRIFLSNDFPLISRLPNYSQGERSVRVGEERIARDDLTDAERKYIDGRRIQLIETIHVGQGSDGSGRSAVVNGRIIDEETGEPVIGATIYFEELKKGSATDADGRFSIVVKTGKHTVEFNCVGMEAKLNYLDVHSDGSLSVSMEKGLISLKEVTVQAKRYHNVRGTQMGFDRLNYKVLKDVPVVMGEKDVLKVVQMLPGVQSVGEGSSGFNVRGSAADQNMIYINKVPVYNSNHLFGFFTTFSPDIVKDFTLYKSNLPASFGGRLASFFDITTRQGNMNEFTARGGVSPITGHIAVEGPIKKEKSAFVLSARSTYSDWILNRMENPDLRDSEAAFYDLAGSLSWKPGEKTFIKAFGYMSNDRFNLGTTNQYDYANAGGSINVRQRFNARITGDLSLVYGEYGFSTIDQNVPSESYSHSYRIKHYEFRADLTWLSLGKHKLTYGANAIWYDLDRGTVEPYGSFSVRAPVDLGIEYGIEPGLYVADEIVLSPRLTVYGGVRFAGFLAMGPNQVMTYEEGLPRRQKNVIDTLDFSQGEVSKYYYGLEPRFSLNFMTGANSSVKFSYNRVRQFLFMLSNTIAISPTDQWKLCDYHITPPYVDQVSVGYYQDYPSKGISTSLEVYYKWVSNVVEYRDGANFIASPHIETETLQGEQSAYGIEAMIKKNSGKLHGWVAYSYARSLMLFNSPIPGENINRGLQYPSNYDRPHNLSVVANYKVNRRISFSANVVYNTGRPATYPISIYYFKEMEFIDYSDRNSFRIPDYFRIDLSLNLEGNLKKRKFMHSYWMLNVYNLTGRKNAYSIFFQREDQVIQGNKLSIFAQPIVTLSWNFKLGNYATE